MREVMGKGWTNRLSTYETEHMIGIYPDFPIHYLAANRETGFKKLGH